MEIKAEGVPNQIRVMRVIARLNVGGPARHVAALAELDDNVFQTLLVHGSVGTGETDMADIVDDSSVRRVVLPELGPRVDWRQDLEALRGLLSLCREFQPHIIHTHTAKAGTLGRLAGAIYGLRNGTRRCRLVHTFHGHVFEHYFGPLTSPMVRLWERILAVITDRIVVLSALQRADIVERFGIAPSRKVRIIPLGLDLDSFVLEGLAPLRDQLGCPCDLPLIGIIGRLVTVKNHELFLRAAHRLIDGGTAAHFVIVGGGDRERQLRELVDALGIARHVTFLGWRRDLAEIYRSLDIVALTSRNEGTPVALIEAMTMERAIIATAIGGVQDVVEHGRTGLLVPSDSIEELSAAMQRLVSDRALRDRLGKAARVAALAKYSKHRLIADTANMYREIMKVA